MGTRNQDPSIDVVDIFFQAYLLLREREAAGVEPISKDLIDPEKVSLEKMYLPVYLFGQVLTIEVYHMFSIQFIL